MKIYTIIVSVVIFVILGGCSMLGLKKTPGITGTWTGEGQRGGAVTMQFNEDNTMTMTFNMDGNSFTMKGNYKVDYSQKPVAVDLLDIEFPQGDMTLSCMAIAEFTGNNAMILYGLFGQPGQVTRPGEFNKNTTEQRELYLELTRSSE